MFILSAGLDGFAFIEEVGVLVHSVQRAYVDTEHHLRRLLHERHKDREAGRAS